ncbi:uncharacterized protein GLRG_00841 [Colletotrichum graminicola M1.001]|uniref:Uncharacterized protein n=1 Tax=Colletotrichum graminicola (strain M1.001 / M2 / FGSC 10212) TaxID=645133 RepID=E3Q3U5_COLGM|nr:uncharacterized protein GLRG_00841 [Colletotrichum graminicola M1.001]EFQ25697.1 hypothetical protein GLRG_00841 [Colletotrichum graminicola M1.001]
MKAATISSLPVAILAATTWAAPVDPEQHPMVFIGHPQVPVAAELAAPGRARPNPTSPVNLITAVWNAIAAGDEKQQRGDLESTRIGDRNVEPFTGGKTDFAGIHADALIVAGLELNTTPPPFQAVPSEALSVETNRPFADSQGNINIDIPEKNIITE